MDGSTQVKNILMDGSTQTKLQIAQDAPKQV